MTLVTKEKKRLNNAVFFSVITVVKDDLKGLKRTRKSLEIQKYNNWKHIIIDSASGPDTQEYLQSLPKKNTIYVSESDSGIYEAMNKGWNIADSESFVFYLNARDTFADSKSLEEASKALGSHPEINWGCTTHEEIQQDGEGWVCKLVSPPSIANQLHAFGYRSHQAVVMKAKFINQLGGFDERYKIAADWELIVKAMVVEKPKVWTHSLGKFELGGASSTRLYEAHLELRAIRRIYLNNNWRKVILDDLWCSIYLRYFGFSNYFTPVVGFLYPDSKRVRTPNARVLGRFKRKFKTIVHILYPDSKRVRTPNARVLGRFKRKFKTIVHILYPDSKRVRTPNARVLGRFKRKLKTIFGKFHFWSISIKSSTRRVRFRKHDMILILHNHLGILPYSGEDAS